MKLDLRPLRRKVFRRILFADAVNIGGDWLGLIALTVIVYDRTDSALITALLFISIMFLPAIASLPAVARLESLPARISLPVIYLVEMALLILLAFTVQSAPIAVIMMLAFIEGTLALSGQSLIRSSVAHVLKPTGELKAGNALLNFIFTGGFFTFPLLAGVAIEALGVKGALLLDAATFLIAALALLGLKGLPRAAPQAKAVRRRLAESFSYVRTHATLKPLLIATTFVIAVVGIVYPVEIILVKGTFGSSDAGYGLFLGACGAGTVLGGRVFALSKTPRLELLLLITVVLMGVAYIATAFAPNLEIASSIQVVGGVGNGFQVAAIFTLIQEMIDDSLQARIVSLTNTVMELAPGAGFIIGGILGTLVSPRAVFFIAGVLALLATAVLSIKMRGLNWPEVVADRAVDTSATAPSSASTTTD